MKEIKITTISAPDKESWLLTNRKHEVYTGNGLRKQFSSKREAKRYLGEINAFLKLKMHEANKLYSEAYTVYRNNWIYFESPKTKGKYRIERDIRTDLASADEVLQAIPTMNWTESNNAWAFINLSKCVGFTADALTRLGSFEASRNNPYERDVCQLLINRCNGFLNEMDVFGKSELVMFIKKAMDKKDPEINTLLKQVR